MNLWTMPSHYAGETWPATYVFLSRNRDSDDLSNSNFETALSRLESLPPFESEDEEKKARPLMASGATVTTSGKGWITSAITDLNSSSADSPTCWLVSGGNTSAGMRPN